jgi:hypothetical protein
MNPQEYLASVKDLLKSNSLIAKYQVVREYEGANESYIRARMTLTDGSLLEFAEYIEPDGENHKITDYSFQWMDADGNQIRRWDNTPHFPKLKNFPHHIHVSEEKVVSGKSVDIFDVLNEIAKLIVPSQ